MGAELARHELAKALHLTMAKLESEDAEWENLSDFQRHYYECCIATLLDRKALILAALS